MIKLHITNCFLVDKPKSAPEIYICTYEAVIAGNKLHVNQYPLTQVKNSKFRYNANTFDVHFMGNSYLGWVGDCHSRLPQVVSWCKKIIDYRCQESV